MKRWWRQRKMCEVEKALDDAEHGDPTSAERWGLTLPTHLYSGSSDNGRRLLDACLRGAQRLATSRTRAEEEQIEEERRRVNYEIRESIAREQVKRDQERREAAEREVRPRAAVVDVGGAADEFAKLHISYRELHDLVEIGVVGRKPPKFRQPLTSYKPFKLILAA